MIKKMIFLFSVIFLSLTLNAQSDYNVLNNTAFGDANNSTYHYLMDQAFSMLDKRDAKIIKIKTLHEWQDRQKFIRKTLIKVLSPFPEKTPLNAKITGIVRKDNFRVENIIFESMPGFYVTSSLFIPNGIKKSNKAPAVIYCSGHSSEAYRCDVYQHILLNLVNKGFVVFAFDPIGQGERKQYFDTEEGKIIVGGSSTKEHSYPGSQLFLTGTSLARYMIWDGMRAVDYLLTRKEVDSQRIGITGRSGGGTQTAYIAAIDERIYAAAPECFITNFTRLLQTSGPQDAEQNMFHFISEGLDEPDYLIVRAPKPTMMITTTNDMFNIQGVLETEKEVKRIFKAYGREENFLRSEDLAPHASTKKNREAMYAFFQKYLNLPGNPKDEDLPLLSHESLKVTSIGHVTDLLNGQTLYSINRDSAIIEGENLDKRRKNLRKFIPEAVNSAKNISGFKEPKEKSYPVYMGRFIEKGYSVEKYFIKGEGDYVLPYVIFRPKSPTVKYLLYLNPKGKADSASINDEIFKYLEAGITVFSPDLLGYGELGPGSFHGDAYIDGVSHNFLYASVLIGRSLTGIRAADVIRLAEVIKEKNPQAEITGLAKQGLFPVLLHAAAFSKIIDGVILCQPYSSFESIAKNRFYKSRFIRNTVPGALTAYDLPDLAVSLAPRRLLIAGPTDGAGKKADQLQINKDMNLIKAGYSFYKASEDLNIISDYTPDDLLKWLK